jgi:hypothetical protein
MKKIILLAIFTIILVSCQPKENEVQCEPPAQLVGGECCEDGNENAICDEFEEVETQNESVEHNEVYLSLDQLEAAINKTFGATHRSVVDYNRTGGAFNRTAPGRRLYVFNKVDRQNLTGIENIFEVKKDAYDQFFILIINESHNYLPSDKEFNDFIQRLYDLEVKNNDIWAVYTIDDNKREDINWQFANYSYVHRLENEKIDEATAFIEKHIVLFTQYGSAFQYYYDFKVRTWCSPELIVEIRPAKQPKRLWGAGMGQEQALDRVESMASEHLNSTMPFAEGIVSICSHVQKRLNTTTTATSE